MKRKLLSILILVLLILQSTLPVFGFSFGKTKVNLELGEYSQAYKEWLELPDEEKEKVIQPNIIDIKPVKVNSSNPLANVGTALSASDRRFSLKDVIPDNVIVRNQGRTELCWAFATLASLESTLGLKDYLNNSASVKYDFSEKHMGYASSNSFLDNKFNIYGVAQPANSQSSLLAAHTYLVNGMGAAYEDSMPYDTSYPNIDYDTFMRIKRVTEVSDIEVYGGTDDRSAIIQKIKDNVVKHGGVTTAIHGAQPYSGCFNSQTGAIYCNDSTKYPLNHAVSIIGWDDDYSVDNFVDTMKPSSNGAFIVKNSWGENYVIQLDSDEYKQLKIAAYQPYADKYKEMGINSADEIPDSAMKEALQNMGFEVDDKKATMKMGDEGIMYVSYEDANVLSLLLSISNAEPEKNIKNENEYQYDYIEYNSYMATNADTYYLAIRLNKKSTDDKVESITRVGMWTLSPVKAKVFVNPNGTDTNNLKEAPLAEGEYETLTPGYHTLELATPLQVEGDTFTVFVQCTPTEKEDGKSYFPLVSKTGEAKYNNVAPKANQTFYYESLSSFADLGTASTLNSQFSDYIATLKVFTEESKREQNNNNNNNNNNNGGNNDNNNNNNNNNSDQPNFLHTDFSSATSKISEMYDYTFSNTEMKEYLIMNFEVNSVNVNQDRNYTYQYYLSNKQGETNISNWIDMKEVKLSSNQIKFTADSRDISYFNSLLEGQRMYLYVKETESLGGQTNVYVSNAISVLGNDKAVTYKDGNVVSVITNNGSNQSQQGNTSNYGSSSNNSSSSNTGSSSGTTSKDNTTAKTSLPNTGFKDLLFITMFVCTAAGLVLYILYRKIDY